MRHAPSMIGLTVLSLALVACGSSGDATTTTTSINTSTTPPGATTLPEPPTTTIDSDSTTTPGSNTTSAPGLHGEPIDFGPASGDTLAVIGVAHDDALNLRSAPGVDHDIVDEIPPLHSNLRAIGETRQLPSAIWIAVEYEGTGGWVNLQYIGYLGDTHDATAEIIEDLGGRPTAETMIDLGSVVAESLASDEPPSDLVVTVAPSVGDLGEVTYDVIGLGDDSVRGLRVHVFGQPVDGGFSLSNVEITALCGRGVDDGGLCV